jgi:hypothetical protein
MNSIKEAIEMLEGRGYNQFACGTNKDAICLQKRAGISGVCELNDHVHITAYLYDYMINGKQLLSYEIDVYLQKNDVSFSTKAYGSLSELDKIDFIEDTLKIIPNTFNKLQGEQGGGRDE